MKEYRKLAAERYKKSQERQRQEQHSSPQPQPQLQSQSQLQLQRQLQSQSQPQLQPQSQPRSQARQPQSSHSPNYFPEVKDTHTSNFDLYGANSYSEIRRRHPRSPLPDSPSSTSSSFNRGSTIDPVNSERKEDVRPAVCRICSAGDGRLFSPCLCSGTMALVHVKCINQWRRLSSNPTSYFQCDMCKYRYNIHRTQFATIIQSYSVTKVVTALLCLIMVVLFSLICKNPFIAIEEHFYRLIRWLPPWNHPNAYWLLRSSKNILDRMVAGGVGLGSVGFTVDLYSAYRAQEYHRLFPMAICFIGQDMNPRFFRLFCVYGIFVAFRIIYRTINQLSLQMLHKWGETILEVKENIHVVESEHKDN